MFRLSAWSACWPLLIDVSAIYSSSVCPRSAGRNSGRAHHRRIARAFVTQIVTTLWPAEQRAATSEHSILIAKLLRPVE
jgi:hypothetical protein